MIKCLDFTGLHFEALNYKTMMGTAKRFGVTIGLMHNLNYLLLKHQELAKIIDA